MPDNLTVKEVERIWRTAKEQVDDVVWDMVTRLCIAYAGKELTMASERATRFDERPKQWQSLLNRMKEGK